MNRFLHNGSGYRFGLAMVVAWLTVCPLVLGQALPQLTLGKVSAEAGTEVVVPVSLEHSGVVSAVQFEVDFPADQLAFISVEPLALPPASGVLAMGDVSADGTARVVIYSALNHPLPSAVVARLAFRLSSRAPDGDLALAPAAVVASDTTAVEVKPVTLTPGQIHVGAVIAVVPVLAAVQRNANGETSFEVRGKAGARYTIQGSANLGSWSTLATREAEADTILFTDSSAVAEQYHFYRVLVAQ